MQETLSVALLGYGYAGRTFHAPLIASVPGLRLTVVGSGNPAKVHVDLPEADVGTVEEVLARPGVDVVVIATPNDTHVDLRAERWKPASTWWWTNPSRSRWRRRANSLYSAGRGRQLSAFHNRRWDADFLTVQRLIAGGEPGGDRPLRGPFRPLPTGSAPALARGLGSRWGLWHDLGPHLVDQALQLSAALGSLRRPDAAARGCAGRSTTLTCCCTIRGCGHPPRQHACNGRDASLHAAWNARQLRKVWPRQPGGRTCWRGAWWAGVGFRRP